MENRAEMISNFANAGNSMKRELCKDLALQLSHVLNELSSVRLIVDLLHKEHNQVQSELPSDTTMNKQWTQVSYNHQKSLKTMDRILPQHIPETANLFEILTNHSTDIVSHKIENKSVKEANEYVNLRQMKSAHKQNGRLRSRQVHGNDLPNKIPTLVNGSTSTEVSTKHSHHNLKNNTQTIVHHKIMIGDSQA
jgi:hypothetical protein